MAIFLADCLHDGKESTTFDFGRDEDLVSSQADPCTGVTCDEDQVCIDGACVNEDEVECTNDGDCGLEKICEEAKCIAPACHDANYVAHLEGKSDIDVCVEHERWWKVDDYEMWRRAPNACAATSCTIYVDANAQTSTNDGSSASHFKKIQDAIDKAEAGDVICIKPGIYREKYVAKSDEVFKSHLYSDDSFSEKDDAIGLYVKNKGEKLKPIIIAAIGDGDVIIDGENKIDIGIEISRSLNDASIALGDFSQSEADLKIFSGQPKFLEFYGLHIRNFKTDGVLILGSCLRFGDNEIYDNATAIPEVNPEVLSLIDYDSYGNIVFENNKPKTIDNNLQSDGRDNDGDGLVDEYDEWREKANIGRDAFYEAKGSRGNIFVRNHVHDNGWYYKLNCDDAAEQNCPLKIDRRKCRDFPLEYAKPTEFQCKEIHDLFPDIYANKNPLKGYLCINGQAFLSYANPAVAEKIKSDPGRLLRARKSGMGTIRGSGHGFYLHGTAHMSVDNEINDNVGEGFSLRDFVANGEFIDNKVYNNARGIYYIGTGPDVFEGNDIYQNGICNSWNLKNGVSLGPHHIKGESGNRIDIFPSSSSDQRTESARAMPS